MLRNATVLASEGVTKASGVVTVRVQMIEGSAHKLKIGQAEVQTHLTGLPDKQHSALCEGWVQLFDSYIFDQIEKVVD